ncbi:MAG: lysophospholipid acyltransferase family protein [Byssovorax sp.]
MLPARKHRLFNAWFAGVARRRIEGQFGAVRVRGLDRVRALARERPVLLISNHPSWWDPLVVLHVSHHLLGTDGHALMDARNLRRLPFFSLVGAFGVDLDRPADGAAAIRFAAKLLDRPGRLVWVFPQGRERPVTARPLGFRGGSAEIARVARKAVTIPAAIRYEIGPEERPFLYVCFGDPVEASRDTAAGRAAQEAAVGGLLDEIERAIEGDPEIAFDEIYRARPPRMGELATRMLAWLTAPRGG